MTNTVLKVLLGFAALSLCILPAQGDQLYVCQPSPTQDCTSAPGGTALGGGSNLITNTGSFSVGNAGNHTQDNPLLIVVAVFNGSGVPSVSFGMTPSEPLTTLGTYGLTRFWNSDQLYTVRVFGSDRPQWTRSPDYNRRKWRRRRFLYRCVQLHERGLDDRFVPTWRRRTNVFTNTGLISTVTAPEPTGMGLLALGLLGLMALAVLRSAANLLEKS